MTGNYDGAEVCKVSTFILSKLGTSLTKKNTGVYHGNELIVLRNMNAWGTDKMRKIIMKLVQRVWILTRNRT